MKYGTWKGKIGENIYFRIPSPKEIAVQWIIDDGNRSAPNRRYVRSINSFNIKKQANEM